MRFVLSPPISWALPGLRPGHTLCEAVYLQTLVLTKDTAKVLSPFYCGAKKFSDWRS